VFIEDQGRGKMKKELGLALASFGLFLGVIASSAQASIIQWDLVNVTATRSPYETVTGFFDVNSNTGKVTDFSLTVSGLPGGYLPFTFNPVATNFATQQGDGYNGLYYSSPYPNPSQLNYYGFGARTPYRIGVGIVDGGIHLTTSASEGAGYPFNSIFTE
jgi:hypothetical protein